MDPTSILIANLDSAFTQVTQYLGLGLVAAVSALALELQPRTKSDVATEVNVVGGFVKMPGDLALVVLLGAYFVAGLMSSMVMDSAEAIVAQLPPDMLGIACTNPSIATAAVGYRILAAVVPVAAVLVIIWRTWRRVNTQYPNDARAFASLVAFFMVPYLAVAIQLLTFGCAT